MNMAACIVYVVAFLALPPALLLTRLFDKARMPWKRLLAVSVAAGWLLLNLAHMFYVNGLSVQMLATGGNPTNDFLLAFGWLLGPAYLVPWLFLYCIFIFVRWMFSGPSIRRH